MKLQFTLQLSTHNLPYKGLQSFSHLFWLCHNYFNCWDKKFFDFFDPMPQLMRMYQDGGQVDAELVS